MNKKLNSIVVTITNVAIYNIGISQVIQNVALTKKTAK